MTTSPMDEWEDECVEALYTSEDNIDICPICNYPEYMCQCEENPE